MESQYIFYSNIESLVEENVVSDVPYEAAIASAGALIAGIVGILACFIKSSRGLRGFYVFSSFCALGKSRTDECPQLLNFRSVSILCLSDSIYTE